MITLGFGSYASSYIISPKINCNIDDFPEPTSPINETNIFGLIKRSIFERVFYGYFDFSLHIKFPFFIYNEILGS